MREETIKDRVFHLLDKNHLLLPKQICAILGLEYKDYDNYVTVLRSKWNSLFKSGVGLKSLSFHHAHAFVYVPKFVSDDVGLYVGNAVEGGWVRTKAKNGMVLWKDENGRVEWFPTTGRCNIWVRKPASRGKCYQLLANAFFRTAVIWDMRKFQPFLESVKFKGASAVLDVGEKLPYVKIDFLRISNGIVITLGDRSHPTAVEIDFCLPDWAERMEKTDESVKKLLERLNNALEPKGPDEEKTRPEPEDHYRV